MYSILFADDEEELQELIEIEFELSDHKIQCASGGDTAFEKFKNDKFDIIITDENMPTGNGIPFITSVREMGSKVPVILFLSPLDYEKRDQASALGNVSFVEKPFELAELSALVDKLLTT